MKRVGYRVPGFKKNACFVRTRLVSKFGLAALNTRACTMYYKKSIGSQGRGMNNGGK